jgi:hypothetical protein
MRLLIEIGRDRSRHVIFQVEIYKKKNPGAELEISSQK